MIEKLTSFSDVGQIDVMMFMAVFMAIFVVWVVLVAMWRLI